MTFWDICIFAWVVLVIWFGLSQVSHAYLYCGPNAPDLCSNIGGKHVVCDPEQVESAGTFVGYYPSTNKLRDYIIERHNYYRDRLAGGRELDGSGKKYPAATRMRELIWDAELEYISKVHATRCNLAHDKCRTATKFPFTGQNLGWRAARVVGTAKLIIDMSIDFWYSELTIVMNGNAMSKKFESTYMQAGHFTQMIGDQCSRVGCAIAYCENCTGEGSPTVHPYCYEFTCDYDCSNVYNRFIYKTGDIASDCAHWKTEPSNEYLNLCKATGKNFPVEYK